MTKRILLICANQRLALQIQVALLRYELTVEVAGSFRRGLAVIQHRPPMAIVIDEAIPALDTAQLADVLKVAPATATLPVVMLTWHEETLLERQYGAGDLPARGEAPASQVLEALRYKGVF